MALRIAVPRMTFFIEQYSLGNLGGFLGSVYQDLHRTVFKNASFIVKEASGDIFLDDDSDAKSPKTNETTFKELFMRNEADMCGVLLEYRTVSKYLSPSCPVIDISGAALHTPLLRVTYQNVLNTLNVFSVGVISGIFLNVALLGIFLKLTKKIHLIDSTSSLSKCLINQANFNAGLLKAKALIMFWLICSFLIMEIYEQAINADMVTFDYSRIVESLIDLDRHKSYAPRFIQGDPILDHFKRSSDPVKKRVWNRKNKGVYQDHHQAFYGSFYKEVYIGSWGNVIGIGEVLCEMWRQKYKYLIATKGFGSATIGFQYRSNLPEKVKRQIWHTSLKIGETGIAQRLVEKHRRLITSRPTHSTPTCLCYSKEGLHEDEETLRPIGSEDMSSLIAIFRLFWALSVTVFLAELISNGIRVLRRRSSNKITSFLDSDSLQSQSSEMISPCHSQGVKLPSTDPTLKPGAFLMKQTEINENVSYKKLVDQLEVLSVHEESEARKYCECENINHSFECEVKHRNPLLAIK